MTRVYLSIGGDFENQKKLEEFLKATLEAVQTANQEKEEFYVFKLSDEKNNIKAIANKM